MITPRTSPPGGACCWGPAGPDGPWALAAAALVRKRRPRTTFRVRRIGILSENCCGRRGLWDAPVSAFPVLRLDSGRVSRYAGRFPILQRPCNPDVWRDGHTWEIAPQKADAYYSLRITS